VEQRFLDHMRHEAESLQAAISDEFNNLTTTHTPGETLRSGRLNEAFAALQAKVNETRDEGVSAPLQTAISFAGYFGAIRSLCDELNNIRSAMEGLPRFGQPLPQAKPHWDSLPTIDWFWVKVGIKGGLAAVVAVLLMNWINPPGPAVIPTMAWMLTIFGRPFLRVGETGDLRAFQNASLKALAVVGCVPLVILITPFLAGYAVMNLVLFLILFIFGLLTARIPGINSWMLVGFLTITGLLQFKKLTYWC
jgi:hypothetical protein